MLFVAREIRAPLDGRALRAVGCINSTTKFLFGVRAAHFPSPARLIARYNAAPVHFRRRRSVHPTTEASGGGERGGAAAAANPRMRPHCGKAMHHARIMSKLKGEGEVATWAPPCRRFSRKIA